MALVIAGTNSGCGKSTVTLGVLSAMKRLGVDVQPFKAGPDFIDPGLHTMITGRISRNLDLWMCGKEYINAQLARHADAEAHVVEGVMGFYDGDERSTASISDAIDGKVVLVLDAYGMAESAGAILEGFSNYSKHKNARIDGVIFNRVGSERHYLRLKNAAGDIKPLGYLPRDVSFEIPERHLGLLVAEESPLDAKGLNALTDAVIKNIDMETLIKWAEPEQVLKPRIDSTEKTNENKVRLGVARDKAFCFYYQDNLDMLAEAGAEIVPFSPLTDTSLPDGLDGLYIGGGYPEMHAGTLEANESMRQSIKSFADSGAPVYAECGGFMYLSKMLSNDDGKFNMCGVFPIETRMRSRRSALGYKEVTVTNDCVLGSKTQTLRGHEFHYSEVVESTHEQSLTFNVLGETEPRVVSALCKNTLASYVHVHLGSRSGSANDFVKFMRGDKWKQ